MIFLLVFEVQMLTKKKPILENNDLSCYAVVEKNIYFSGLKSILYNIILYTNNAIFKIFKKCPSYLYHEHSLVHGIN